MLRFLRVVTFRNGKSVAEFEQSNEDKRVRRFRMNREDIVEAVEPLHTLRRLSLMPKIQTDAPRGTQTALEERLLNALAEYEKALAALDKVGGDAV